MLLESESLVPTVLTVDETYLWRRYEVHVRRDAESSNSAQCIVGGTWPDHASLPPPSTDDGDFSLDPANLAPLMMDFLLKRADFHETISVAHVPVRQKGLNGTVMMSTISPLLQSLLSEEKVGVICIAHDHATHALLLNNFLLGEPLPSSLQQDPFWSTGKDKGRGKPLPWECRRGMKVGKG